MLKKLPGYYRRALSVLGMTNRDLAELLTSARHDEQVTSQATVSRWMTGTTPMDAGVLLYLTGRLRQLARAAVRRPLQTRVIGVGGGKGGTGGSSMSIALALTSHDCGYRTMHVNSSSINNDFLLSVLPHGIAHSGPVVDASGFPKSKYDFVFVDVYRDLVADHANPESEVGTIFNAIDLFVTPLDATSAFDVWGVAKMYALLDDLGRDNRILVHMSSDLEIFGFDTFLEHMEPWKHMLYENAIPRLIGGPFAEPRTLTFGETQNAGFVTEDIRHRYWKLFAAILNRFGLDAEEKIDADKLDFFELIDLVSPPPTLLKTAT